MEIIAVLLIGFLISLVFWQAAKINELKKENNRLEKDFNELSGIFEKYWKGE